MSPLVGERTSGPTVASAALSYKNQIGYTYAFGETGMMIDDLIEAVIAREGGYVDDPADRGGATRWGITERVARQPGYAGAMRAFPRDEAAAIYRCTDGRPPCRGRVGGRERLDG